MTSGPPRSRLRGLAIVSAILISSILTVSKTKAESTYCRKVRARARADAALLEYPRVLAEGIRFPATGRIDTGPTAGREIQARIGLSVAPLDVVRGIRVVDAADADCERRDVAERLERALTEASGPETLRALRAHVAYLDAHRTEWRASLTTAQERLRTGLITLVELHELRKIVDQLERKLEHTRGDAERLQAQLQKRAPQRLAELSKQYVDRALAFERREASVRALDPWGMKLTGAVIPLAATDRPVDWYVFAELSYSLGGIPHDRRDSEYLDARAKELSTAAYELPARARELAAATSAQRAQAEHELRVVEGDLRFIADAEKALETTPAPNLAHAREALAVERLSVEADRVFLEALIDALDANGDARP